MKIDYSVALLLFWAVCNVRNEKKEKTWEDLVSVSTIVMFALEERLTFLMANARDQMLQQPG